MATLLLTASNQVSEALAKKLKHMGHKAIISPLLNVEPVEFAPLAEPPAAILITSRYALDAVQQYADTPLYIIGEQTAKLALAQGHYIARVATDILSIVDFLPDNILYFRGRDVSHELNIPSIICYKAEPAPIDDNIGQYDAAILLSARAASLLPATNAPIFCMSERIKHGLTHEMQEQAIVANSSEEHALLEAIKRWSDTQ